MALQNNPTVVASVGSLPLVLSMSFLWVLHGVSRLAAHLTVPCFHRIFPAGYRTAENSANPLLAMTWEDDQIYRSPLFASL